MTDPTNDTSGIHGNSVYQWLSRRGLDKIGLLSQTTCGSSSVGRASASQAEGRRFEPGLPLRREPYVYWGFRLFYADLM